MKRKYGYAAAAALMFLLAAPHAALAASPGRVSYQGTLRKDGRLFSGTASMEFKLTSADGLTDYWNSGSTDVVVSSGLFRYPLGTPNEAQFTAISWKDIAPYVQMRVDGLWLPAEPLYSSVYSQHAVTAESSTGTFTVNAGDLRLAGASGSEGVIFPDGTVQYYAPGWAVAPTLTYTAFAGSAGLGLASPVARLDVQAAAADPNLQFWRDSGGTVVASMTAAGVLYAEASGIRNLPAGADSLGTHVATAPLQMAGFPVVNAGSITVSGPFTAYSSATIAGGTGLGTPRVWLSPGVEVSSSPAAFHGGVYVSSNIYLPVGAKYYGDGSALTGVSGADTLGTHVATRTLEMANFPIVDAASLTLNGGLTAYSSVTVAGELGLVAGRLELQPGVEVASAAPANYGGVYVSSHIYLPAGAKFYGDGSSLTGLTGVADNLGSHIATTTLLMANYPIVNAGGLTANGQITTYSSVTVAGALGLAAGRVELRPGAEISSASAANFGGLFVSSHVFLPAGARFYGDGSGLTLSAAYLSFGTLADARLGPNVPLLASTQTFTGANVFLSSAAFTLVDAALPGVAVSSGLVMAAGNAGFGTASPAERVDVAGGVRIGNSGNSNAGTLRYTGAAFEGYHGGSWLTLNGAYSLDTSTALWGINDAVTPNTVYTVGQSSNVAIGTMDAGVSKLRVTGSGNTSAANALLAESLDATQLLRVRNDGLVAVGPHAPATRLDVRSVVADPYAQIWRDSAGLEVSSMGAGGILYASALGLRDLPPGADSFGSHIATQTVLMAGFPLVNVGSVTVSGQFTTHSSATVNGELGLASARLELRPGVELSSAAAAAYGGVYISSHVFLPAGARFYGDGSGLVGVTGGADSLGSHIATMTLQMGNFPILNAGHLTANGQFTTYSSATVAGALGLDAARLRLAAGVELSSAAAAAYGGVSFSSHVFLQAGAKYYGDGSALTGIVSADTLGTHVATTTLQMANFPIVNADHVTANGQFTTYSSATVAGALGLGAARLRLADGVELSSAAAAAYGGVSISSHVFLPAGAKFYGDGGGLTGLSASGLASGQLADARLGPNVPLLASTQAFTGANAFTSSAAFTLADAALPGVFISSGLVVAAGNAGFGTAAPAERVDVAGGVRIGNSGNANPGTLRYTGAAFEGYHGGSWLTLNGAYSLATSTALWGINDAVTPNTVYTVGQSSNVAIGTMDAGVNKLRVTGSDNSAAANALLAESLNATQLFRVRNDGAVAVGPHAPAARLDVQPAPADLYVQIWRDSAGVEQASMTQTGVLYADASQLRNLPSGNVVDTLADTLAAGRDAGGTYINNLSSAAIGLAAGEAALDAQAVAGNSYVQIWRNAAGVIQASMTASGVIYAESSGLRGGGGGNVVDTLADTLAAGHSAGNTYINNLSSAAIGLAAGEAVLDAQAFGGDLSVQIWRDSTGVIQASMTQTGVLYADGSQLRNYPQVATQDYNLNDFKLINASTITAAPGEPGIAFSTTLYVGGNVFATGGAMFTDGPLLVGTQLPLATVHVSSVAGFAGDMVMVSTGGVAVVRLTGAGGVHASKFYGDGSGLTNIAGGGLTNPMLTDLDMGGNRIFNLAEIDEVAVSSRLAVGHDAGPSSPVVAMVMETFANADISPDFPNEGVGTLVMVEPTENKTGAEMLIGGDFIAGTVQNPGNLFSFPAILGLRATALAQTGGTISAAYGLYTQNRHSAGTVDNNFGVYVDVPNSTATITNNTGLYVKNQRTFGVPYGHNIVSEGADSVNYFEGTVQAGKVLMSGGGVTLTSMPKILLSALVPESVGEMYFCSNCSPAKIVVSTGTAAGNFAAADGGAFQ